MEIEMKESSGFISDFIIENIPYDCNTVITVFDRRFAEQLKEEGFIMLAAADNNFSGRPLPAEYWQFYKPGHDLMFDVSGAKELTEKVIAIRERATANLKCQEEQNQFPSST